MIGHGERFCERIFEGPMESIEKSYGVWLRAEPQRKTHKMGAKWLRSGGNFQAKNSGGNGEGSTDKESPVINAQVDQDTTNVGIESIAKKIKGSR